MNEISYEAFFDELHQIEKRAMLSHAAGMEKEANIVSSTARGFKMMATSAPKQTFSRIGKIWRGGQKAQVKRLTQQGEMAPGVKWGVDNLTGLQKFTGGMRGLARSGTGKALGATALGVGALGAGAYGVGRMSGRSSVAPGR